MNPLKTLSLSSTARRALSLSLVCAATSCFGQAGIAAPHLLTFPMEVASATPVPAAEESLPDAPSYTMQQQAAPAQTPAGTSTSAPPPDVDTPPANETEAQKKEREKKQAQKELEAEEKQRVGGLVPNFNVVIGGKALPLSAGQKFNLAFHSITDPYPFGLAAVIAGVGEIEDSHTGFGHGPSGYFKRFGAAYADTAIGTMIGNAALPVLLHQDPRYFRKGSGTIKSRIIYSALTTFICRSDSGKRQFNLSNVGGNFISGAISNAYYPADERGVGLTIENGAVVTAEGMLGAQLLEFGPDLNALLSRMHQRKLERQRVKAEAAAAAKNGTPAPATPKP